MFVQTRFLTARFRKMVVLITLFLFKILFLFSKRAHDKMFDEIKVIADNNNMNKNLIGTVTQSLTKLKTGLMKAKRSSKCV